VTDTTAIRLINIQVLAEDAVARDMADGTYSAKIAANSRHYLWHGTEQAIPVGMNSDPEGYAAAIRAAMPLVNTLRVPFNAYSFNDDGSLHPQIERFLTAAAEQGFRLILVQNDGEAQTLGSDAGWTPAALAQALGTSVVPRMEAAWAAMRDWLGDNPQVDAAVWGLEMVNEPATWARGAEIAPWGTKQTEADRFAALYTQHMERLATAAGASDAQKVLIGGWRYSGTFDALDRPVINGLSALDHLRAAFGDQLVWSAHLYPGWHGTDRLDSPQALIDRLAEIYAPVANDAVLLTEFNLTASIVNDVTRTDHVVHQFGRLQDWFAEQGFGIGWFPGTQGGASSLVTIDAGGALRFLNQHSYAFAMNAFTLGAAPEGTETSQVITAELIAGRLRNQTNDPDWSSAQPFDPVAGFGLAVGWGGDDTLLGRAYANNLLYGGTGGDLLTGHDAEDFLFGQAGNDTLVGGAGRDFLYGGTGNDILSGGPGDDVMEGGTGADWFVATSGNDVILDFSAADGDVLSLGRGYTSWAQVASRISSVAVDGTTAHDLRITHADGSTTTLLNPGAPLREADLRFSLPELAPQAAPAATSSWTFTPSGGHRVHGSILDDILQGQGQGRLSGMGGNDRLSTGQRADTLDGGAGNDTLVVSAGGRDHVLTGGAGADRFEFSSQQGGATARITDFSRTADRLIIDSRTIDLAALPADVRATATGDGLRVDYADHGSILLEGFWL